MKHHSIVLLGLVFGLTQIVGSVPANADQNDMMTFVPSQCALEETKEEHPKWYRMGGYCRPYDGEDDD